MTRGYRGLAAFLLGLALTFTTASCDRSADAPTAADPGGALRTERTDDPPRDQEDIGESLEVQRVQALQGEFMMRVDAAMRRGVSREQLRAAAHATTPGNDLLGTLLFGGEEEASRYVTAVREANQAVLDAFPEVAEARGSMSPSSCAVGGNAVDSFFDNFEALRDDQLASERNAPCEGQPSYLGCTSGCATNSNTTVLALCYLGCKCRLCSSWVMQSTVCLPYLMGM